MRAKTRRWSDRVGGNEGQTVSHSAIRDPRGFTGIHFREGDRKQCKSATIEGNEIGLSEKNTTRQRRSGSRGI